MMSHRNYVSEYMNAFRDALAIGQMLNAAEGRILRLKRDTHKYQRFDGYNILRFIYYSILNAENFVVV